MVHLLAICQINLHPDEDRFLTVRECMSIMKLPEDFTLQGGLKGKI